MRTSISQRSLAEELRHRAGATLPQTLRHSPLSLSRAGWREHVIKAKIGGLQQRRNFITITAGSAHPLAEGRACACEGERKEAAEEQKQERRGLASDKRRTKRENPHSHRYPSDVADHEEPRHSFHEKHARGRSPSKGCGIIEISFGEIPPPHQPAPSSTLSHPRRPAPLSAAVAPPLTHPRGLHHHPPAGRGAGVPRA